MKIENGTLTVDDGRVVVLPAIPRDARVRVWSVPLEYRENGLFVAVDLHGDPAEVPACSLDLAEYLGEVLYPADESQKLDAAKAAKLRELNAACELSLSALTSAYPGGELQSWPQQVQEAEAVLLDPKADATLLAAIAGARGLTVDDLARRVQEKAKGYAALSGAAIGRRQAAEDALDLAETLEEVGRIVW